MLQLLVVLAAAPTALAFSVGAAAAGLRLPVAPPRAQMAAPSYEKPALPPLPEGFADVDALTAEALRGFCAAELQAAAANLEVAIFDSPPFKKVNEEARRRNCALALFLQDDPALHPLLIPHVKEVLRRKKGADAEMQYCLGVAMTSCMEGAGSQTLARRCFEKALELDPAYEEAKAALANA